MEVGCVEVFLREQPCRPSYRWIYDGEGIRQGGECAEEILWIVSKVSASSKWTRRI